MTAQDSSERQPNRRSSERRQLDRALRECEERYQALFASIDCVFLHDFEGRFLEANPAALKLLGYEHEEILGISFSSLLDDDHLARAFGVLAELKETRSQKTPTEFRLRRKAGDYVNVEIKSSVILRDGQPYAVLGIGHDITDRKRAEEELRESEARYRLLFDAIDEGFCIVEVLFDNHEKPIDYRFLQVNAAFERQTGLVDAQGKRMRELAPKHEEHWFEIYGKIAVTGQPARFVNRAEQLHRWYDVYAFRVGQPEDRQVGILFSDITERKRTEEALRESEARYREILEHGGVGVAYWDLDGRLLFLNERAVRNLGGSSPEEVLGKTFPELFGEEAGSVYLARIRQTATSPESIVHEDCVDLPIGRRWFTSVHTRSQDAAGNVDGVHVYATDITERKQAEEELRESEEQVRQLFESVPQLVWTCQPEGLCDYLGPQWVTFTGVPEAPQLGYGWLEQVHPDDREPTLAAWLSQCAAGSDFHIEFRIRRHDGVYRWFDTQAKLMHDLSGCPTKWFGSNTDITERKQAEELLRLTQFAVDHSSDLVHWFGPEGRLLYVNDSSCRRLGYSREELLGMTVYDIDPGAPQPWSSHFQEVKERGSFTFESSLRTKDGEIIPVDVTVNYVNYGGQEYNCATSRDITERKQAEETLRQSEEQLRQIQKMEAVGQLAGGIAHDFNNLLTAILGYSDLMLASGTSPAGVRPDLEEIKQAAERASALTKQILAFSRRQALRPDVVSLNEVLRGRGVASAPHPGREHRSGQSPPPRTWA